LLPLARQAISELPNAVNEFSTAVNSKFEPAAQRHTEVVEAIGSGVTEFNQLVAELRGATSELRRTVDRQANAADAFQPACSAVRGAASDLGKLAQSLQGTVAGEMLPAQQELRGATDSLRRSVETLAAFIDNGVAPATQRLQALDVTIASLQAVVNDVRPLAAMSRDAARLFEGISKAAAVAFALSELPQKVNDCLAKPLEDLTLAVSKLDKGLRPPPTPGPNGSTIWGRLLGRPKRGV
jgi:methyl-accepting chemotaxis protein